MTDRRSHWDASLISAVLADLRDVYESGYGEDQAFRIIAAVEDWARWEHVPKGTLRRLERAEAAIQRVREVCDLWQRRYDSSIRHPTDIPAVAIVAVLRALEGDSE